MWVFLGSDCLLFGALISTYMLYKDRIGPTDLGPEEMFDIPFTSVSSFVLLMSSLTVVLAITALRRNDIRRSRIWLLSTAILGAIFVGAKFMNSPPSTERDLGTQRTYSEQPSLH